MARQLRLQVEGCFYHVSSRGNDRKTIFRSEHDYRKFLEYLAIGIEKYKYYIHAYCLMPNHYHLFLETTQANLSRIMHYLNTSYTVYYNVKHNRSGHLFQGRYKSIIVERDSYYVELSRYIHLNPVRAKIVESPEKYLWSSYNTYINGVSGKKNNCLDIARIKECLIMSTKQYKTFVENDIEKCSDPLKNVYAGSILGSAEFIKDKLDRLSKDIETKDFAHKRAVKNIIGPEDIISAVANKFNISAEKIKTGVSRPMTAKKMAIYLLRRKTGLINAQIGKMFNMTPATISKAAVNFEKGIVEDKKLAKTVEELCSTFEG